MRDYYVLMDKISTGDIEFIERFADDYYLTMYELLQISVDRSASVMAAYAYEHLCDIKSTKYIVVNGDTSLIIYLYKKSNNRLLYIYSIIGHKFDAATRMMAMGAHVTVAEVANMCLNDNLVAVKWVINSKRITKKDITRYLNQENMEMRLSRNLIVYLY